MTGTDAQRRQLGAIVFTDIVGYSALVNRDEALGLRQLDRQRRIVRRLLPAYEGREIETAGDSFLLLFDSVFTALRCVAAIQQAIAADHDEYPAEPPLELRASIHVGDIERRGREVLGNAVNIAARLMPLSPPGGIALSDQAYAPLRDKLDPVPRSMGPQHLKNIRQPVEVLLFDADQVAALPSAGRTAALDRRHWSRWLRPPLRRRTGLVLSAAFVLGAACVFAATRWSSATRAVAEDVASPQTIAVLPFAALSQGEGDQLLALGVQDSVLTSLARAPSLKVISRTSVSGYADTGTRKLTEIARELGAGTVLEGSLQRQGDRILVQAQLIDAGSDQHLWAQSYDRKLGDLFAVQADIAQQVAHAVRAELSPKGTAVPAAPTTSIDAYQDYQRARDILDRGLTSDLPKAQQALEQALARDAGFALALTALAEVHLNQYAASLDRSPERLQKVRDALVRAAEAQPGLPELHRGWGHYYLYGPRELAAALAEFETALRLKPNDPEVLASASSIYLEQGQLDRALLYQRRAVELDPRSFGAHVGLMLVYELLRDFTAMRRQLDRAAPLAPGSPAIPVLRARIALAADGDVAAARQHLQGVDYAPALERLAYYAADWDEMIRQVRRQGAWQAGGTQAAPYPAQLSLAVALWLKGDREAARVPFLAAREQLETALAQSDSAPWDQLAGLSLAQAALGDADGARRTLARLEACADCLTPKSRADIRSGMAMTRLVLGDKAGALGALQDALGAPSTLTAAMVRIDPAWIPLRGEPAFQRLIASAPGG